MRPPPVATNLLFETNVLDDPHRSDFPQLEHRALPHRLRLPGFHDGCLSDDAGRGGRGAFDLDAFDLENLFERRVLFEHIFEPPHINVWIDGLKGRRVQTLVRGPVSFERLSNRHLFRSHAARVRWWR